MAKYRILVVDDAVVFRRLVAEELARDPELEVIGTAANGRIALTKITQSTPDLVILDVEMPEVDGLTTLAELRKLYPRLPVIMFSALTERGAAVTLDALALGAKDYFTKPMTHSVEASLQIIREQLIPKIKILCASAVAKISSSIPASSGSAPIASERAVAPVEVLTIGTSTGGPNALAAVLPRLPADFPVPILIVQHMPPMFTRLLAERLTAESKLPVKEAVAGTVLEPGTAWIAPGDYHMITVRDGTRVRLQVNQDPPENSCHPAVDALLRRVARPFGANSLTVILSGMGQDGLRGCELLRKAGGQILAQDEASSVVWGMPGYVARANLADRVLPLALVAPEIMRRVPR